MIVLALAACTTPAEKRALAEKRAQAQRDARAAECRTAEWRAVGYEDGSQGLSPAAFKKYRQDCGRLGIAIKFDDYQAGYEKGLAFFCRPQNAFKLGARGATYSGDCPLRMEDRFQAAHADGMGLFMRRQTRDEIGERLGYAKRRLKELESGLADRTVNMVLYPRRTARAGAGAIVSLKHMQQEKAELEASIPKLEAEFAEADRADKDHRRQVAAKHRS